jgi:hypothetical protein
MVDTVVLREHIMPFARPNFSTIHVLFFGTECNVNGSGEYTINRSSENGHPMKQATYPTKARDHLAEARIPNMKVCIRKQDFECRMRMHHSPTITVPLTLIGTLYKYGRTYVIRRF